MLIYIITVSIRFTCWGQLWFTTIQFTNSCQMWFTNIQFTCSCQMWFMIHKHQSLHRVYAVRMLRELWIGVFEWKWSAIVADQYGQPSYGVELAKEAMRTCIRATNAGLGGNLRLYQCAKFFRRLLAYRLVTGTWLRSGLMLSLHTANYKIIMILTGCRLPLGPGRKAVLWAIWTTVDPTCGTPLLTSIDCSLKGAVLLPAWTPRLTYIKSLVLTIK